MSAYEPLHAGSLLSAAAFPARAALARATPPDFTTPPPVQPMPRLVVTRGMPLGTLRDECAAAWQDTPATLPRLGPHVPWHRQWRNGRAAAAMVDEVGARLAEYPLDIEEQQRWREALRCRLGMFGERHLDWPSTYSRMIEANDFYVTATAFARMSREFDPSLSISDLGQALRNVWVANTLQILAGAPVRLTPGLFAYSMLYPATDNVLDARDVPEPTKRAFNQRLGRWLTGEAARPANGPEEKVRSLVSMIEQEFPRAGFPAVWTSVLDIYHAQGASLGQQGTPLPDADLLELTLAKGGASVRADLFLVTGNPDPPAERLSFFYGAFLQLLDDLQDVDSDLAAGHETLFTKAARAGNLDTIAMRLAQFIDVALARHHGTGVAARDCLELIRRNCRMLLVGVIARTPDRFSRTLRRTVQREWPLPLRAMPRLLKRAQHRLETSSVRLRRRHGVDTPLDLLLRA